MLCFCKYGWSESPIIEEDRDKSDVLAYKDAVEDNPENLAEIILLVVEFVS